MIELHSLTVMLAMQLSIALLLLVVIYLVWTLHRHGQEQANLRRFILRMNKGESQNLLRLGERLRLVPAFDEGKLRLALAEYGSQEKRLYRQIFDLILRRNLKELNMLDQRLGALVAPLLDLLASLPEHGSMQAVDPVLIENLQAELRDARVVVEDQSARIRQLREESHRLSAQLGTALETLEEVSHEYSRMFGADKSAGELASSLQKMQNLFHQTEEKLRNIEALLPEISPPAGENP
jgi:hypothetical protein